MNEREQFEAYMSEGGKWLKAVERDGNGQYVLALSVAAWKVWQARAALAASHAPAGRKLVPVEPIIDMRVAAIVAFNRCEGDRDDALQAAWAAMLDTAPQPTIPALNGLTESETLATASVSAPAQQAGVKCDRCNGTGVVDDGEIDCYENGEPYLNGPVKCVKDCPACGGTGRKAATAPSVEAPHIPAGDLASIWQHLAQTSKEGPFRNVCLASVAALQAAPSVEAQAEPRECAASGRGCSFGAHGPNGKRQCEYCGEAPSVEAQPSVRKCGHPQGDTRWCPDCEREDMQKEKRNV